MRKLPFEEPGLVVPGSWRRSSGISSVQRNWARLSRATLPPSPSHRTWPVPPRPGAAARIAAVAPKPLAEHVQDAAHDIDDPRHQLRERLAVQPERARLRGGGDGGQARLRIEQGQLSEDLLRPELHDRARPVV